MNIESFKKFRKDNFEDALEQIIIQRKIYFQIINQL
jgi:hypothetical protein